MRSKAPESHSKPRSFRGVDKGTNMEIQAVREQMRVLVARPLTGDIRSDVGKVGTVMKVNRRWIEVALDGESSTVPFRAIELEPVRPS